MPIVATGSGSCAAATAISRDACAAKSEPASSAERDSASDSASVSVNPVPAFAPAARHEQDDCNDMTRHVMEPVGAPRGTRWRIEIMICEQDDLRCRWAKRTRRGVRWTRARQRRRLDPEAGTQDEDRWRVVAGLELRGRPAVRDGGRRECRHGEKGNDRWRGRIRARRGVARVLALGAMLEAQYAALRDRLRCQGRAMARGGRCGRVSGRCTRWEEHRRAGMRSQCPLQPENSEQGHDGHPTTRGSTHGEIRPYSGAGLHCERVRIKPLRPTP